MQHQSKQSNLQQSPDGTQKPTRYFTDKILSKNPIPKLEQVRKSKDNAYFGYTYDKPGNHPLSMGIDFRGKDGSRMALFFHEIASPILYTPEKGISFSTRSHQITIKGVNLLFIYDLLIENRLMWIQEADNSFDTSIDENEPIPEKVTFTELG